jgi:RNA polymerase primary sigma factor
MRQLKIEDRITERTIGIRRYFNDIENNSYLLSTEEEYELALRVREGDREAYRLLVTANLRFVVSVAKQYSRGGDSLSELIAQGNIGLLEAAEKFDPSRGFKFISFAVWFIRKEILLYLNQFTKTVRVPQSIILDSNRIKKAEAKLVSSLGRDPLPEEIVDEVVKMGWPMTLEKLEKTRIADRNYSTPLESSNPDDEWSPIDWLDSGDTSSSLLESNDSLKSMSDVLNKLNAQDKELIILRLGLTNGDPLSFHSIGQKYGKTSEWARQNYDKAIRKIKSRIENKKVSKKYEI